ncbi:MAG: S1C family serine protease [Tepidisphaeraceae bacterium]|jgi:serine protease Do
MASALANEYAVSRAWGRLIAWLIAAALTVSPDAELRGDAVNPPATRPTTRPLATSVSAIPRNVQELRDFQTRVETVVRQVMPSVVAVFVGNMSQGSGVVVSKDGLVLTAGHVSAAAGRDAWVVFPDGKRHRAKTLGLDRAADAGMVQISEKGEYPPVEMATATPRIGQWCLALGHPGGYVKSRTPPVRLGRIIMMRDDSLMSSCTLVGGDSGGPLFDLDGRLIGIHSRIGPNTAYNIHIPMTSFTRSWERMAAGEAWGAPLATAGSPMMGVQLADRGDTAIVEAVTAGSAAEKAGIRTGDEIRTFDGKPVRGREALAQLILQHKAGDTVPVEVVRGRETKAMSVKLQPRP